MSTQGIKDNLIPSLPTKEFSFLIDPNCFIPPDFNYWYSISNIIEKLSSFDSNIKIHILVPTSIAEIEIESEIIKYPYLKPEIITGTESNDTFEFHESIKEGIQKLAREDNRSLDRQSMMISSSIAHKVDGLVTDEIPLQKFQYKIYQHHRIRIISKRNFTDTIEIIAHGNSIFESATSTIQNLDFGVYYVLAHWKGARYFKWYERFRIKSSNQFLNDLIRSAVCNRYPFVLFSRDMARYYEFQKEHFSKRGQSQAFGLMLAYYINNYYLMIWGMLDHLSLIAKYKLSLDISDKGCGIRSKSFWKQARQIVPHLSEFLNKTYIKNWIDLMADMRHHAAHKTIKSPTALLEDTEESMKTDEEIVNIIKKEKANSYEYMDPSVIKLLEPWWIQKWRINKMSIVGQNVVKIKRNDGTAYIYDPVISIDHDLQILNAVIDAFIVSLFNKDN